MARKSVGDAALAELRAFGLQYPGAHTKSPWPGHLDLAVNDKTFAYLSVEGDPFSIGCKLPHSSEVALMLPYATPTPYGLGKSGWVTAKPAESAIDLDMFKEWIDESYRAQAPKKLVKQLDSGAPLKITPAQPRTSTTPTKPRASAPATKPRASATGPTKKATKPRASAPAPKPRASATGPTKKTAKKPAKKR